MQVANGGNDDVFSFYLMVVIADAGISQLQRIPQCANVTKLLHVICRGLQRRQFQTRIAEDDHVAHIGIAAVGGRER
jgi:hypothetical protein